MKKDEYFIDISSYQSADASQYASQSKKTVIKLTEGVGWRSANAIGQSNTSDVQGYYHFARFGGSVVQAKAEADYFISQVPKRVKWLVLDYESDPSSSKSANTDAAIAFMDKVRSAGYKPILYTYVPFAAANFDLKRITDRYGACLWFAGYAVMSLNDSYGSLDEQVLKQNLSANGISWALDKTIWYQFTSTALPQGLDKNIVFIADVDVKEIIEKSKEEGVMYTVSAKDRGVGSLIDGQFFSLYDPKDPAVLKKAGAVHLQVSQKTFDGIQNNAINTLIRKALKDLK